MTKLLAAVGVGLLTLSAIAQETTENPSSEVDRYTAMFNEADTDKDSYLNADEAQAIGLSGASFSSLDSDTDRNLSLQEFLALIDAGQGTR